MTGSSDVRQSGQGIRTFIVAMGLLLTWTGSALAQSQAVKNFHATIVDKEGVETEVTSLVFFWEEKLNEQEVALYELRHLPVKRGAATINVKFESIQSVEFRANEDGGLPILSVTVKSGKTGIFTFAQEGNFRGQSDFGEMVIRPSQLNQIRFK